MGTLTAPACAIPRSATVHSTRVEPTKETLSSGFTPDAIRAQAASSARPPSSAQVSGFQAPPVLRSAAIRCGSLDARSRNSPARERTAAKPSFSLCIESIVFCAVAIAMLAVRGSARMELCGTLLQKGLRPLFLVFGSCAESEQRSFQRLAFGLARLQSLVHRLERVLHRERSVGENLLQDRFGARDQLGRRNDVVDEADPIGFLRADHLSGEDELQGASFPDQPRPALRAAAPP